MGWIGSGLLVHVQGLGIMAGGSAVGEFRGRVSGFKVEGSGRSAARGRPELKPAALNRSLHPEALNPES